MSKRTPENVSSEALIKNQIMMQEVRRISDEKLQEDGHAPRFFIDTYGCQMNEHDSEKLHGMLKTMGYVEGESFRDADLVIINTCCVRENAEQRVFGNLGHMKPIKEKRKDFKIAVCGCMMQQPQVVEKIKQTYTQVDLIFGTHNLHEFPELLLQTFDATSPIINVWQTEGTIIEGLPAARRVGVKAYVDIMYGCNNFCTYCIVPYTRGRERSRSLESILAEIEGLVAEGVKEVTLLGQNVNSYGVGLEPAMDFPDLLRAVDAIPGIRRVRFMTNHPKDVPDKLIRTMAECPTVCAHIHLPLQAGSNALLKAMNRYYTLEEYLEVVKRLRDAMPDIALTTDIIIGFPGETEADIDSLIAVAKALRFDSAYTFLYSPRTGTPAAKMAGQIPEALKQERFERVLKVFNTIVKEKNSEQAGKIAEVLVESQSKKNDQMLTGRDEANRIVNFKGDPADIGQMVQVKITEPKSFSLLGEKIG